MIARIAALAAFVLAAACSPPADEATAAPAPAPTPAVAGAWTIDKAASSLRFTATQTGKEFAGAFEKFDATIVFDPADLSRASIDVSVDMASARTGDSQRDAALPTGDWFRTKDFPTARFVSTEVEETAPGAYVAHGALTIREATRDLDLPFTLSIDGARARAAGGVSLVRTDFGVGEGEFTTGEWVGLDVKVTFEIEATR